MQEKSLRWCRMRTRTTCSDRPPESVEARLGRARKLDDTPLLEVGDVTSIGPLRNAEVLCHTSRLGSFAVGELIGQPLLSFVYRDIYWDTYWDVSGQAHLRVWSTMATQPRGK